MILDNVNTNDFPNEDFDSRDNISTTSLLR